MCSVIAEKCIHLVDELQLKGEEIKIKLTINTIVLVLLYPQLLIKELFSDFQYFCLLE